MISNNTAIVSATGGSGCQFYQTGTGILDHKYYQAFSVKASVDGKYVFNRIGNSTIRVDVNSHDFVRTSRVYRSPNSYANGLEYNVSGGNMPTDATYTVKNCIRVDLTQMFGSDSGIVSALGLESVDDITANDGIKCCEAFERLFPKSYYAYDEGSLLSFNPTDIQTTGFNQYDNSKQTENVHVLADNKYKIKGTYTGLTYSDGSDVTITSDGYFTSDRVDRLTLTGGNNVDTCVHLSWSGYRDGDDDYEKYWSVNTDLTWIKTLEHNGEVLFPNGLCKAGDVYDEISEGKAIKRVGSVDLGSLTWSAASDNNWASALNMSSNNNGINFICPKFIAAYKTLSNLVNNEGRFVSGRIYLKDTTYSDAAAFKAAMSGVMLYYELETPIVVDLPEGINLNYRMDDFGTEEFINTTTASDVPGLCKPTLVDIGYQTNLRDKIRRLDDNYVSLNPQENSESKKLTARQNIDAASTSGSYPQMTVGNLIADVDTPREFTFDQTGGGGTVVGNGYADVKKIDGNTIVWNQITNPEVASSITEKNCTITRDAYGKITIVVGDGGASGNLLGVLCVFGGQNWVVGHKYLCKVSADFTPSVSTVRVGNNYYLWWDRLGYIWTCSGTAGGFFFQIVSGCPTGTYILDKAFIVDLTKMFGAGNEPTTVEEFERLFPIEYAPYCEGRLVSLGGYGIKWNQLVNTSTTSVTLTSGHKFYTKISGTASVVTGSGNTQATTGGTDMVCDLTEMFGPGSEPTIEEFEAMFGTEYCPYDEGTEMNVLEKMGVQDDLSVKSVGFNQWDEEWEIGDIDNQGIPVSGSNRIRAKNFNTCLPNVTYYVRTPSVSLHIWTYDANKSFIGGFSVGNASTFTPNSNARYFKVSSYPNYPTYKNDICINLSDPAKNGTYLPYTTSTQDLSWIYDLEYTPSGSTTSEKLFPYGLLSAGDVHDEVTDTGAVKRIGSVDLGSLSWEYNSEANIWQSSFKMTNVEPTQIANAISPLYTVVVTSAAIPSMSIGINKYATAVNNGSTTSTPSGILYYELETPIAVTFSSPKDLGYNVQSGGTEALLPANPSGSGPITAPVLLSVNYPLDAVGTLTNLPVNYISIETMDAFTNALGSALGYTITRGAFDGTKYPYTVVKNS